MSLSCFLGGGLTPRFQEKRIAPPPSGSPKMLLKEGSCDLEKNLPVAHGIPGSNWLLFCRYKRVKHPKDIIYNYIYIMHHF